MQIKFLASMMLLFAVAARGQVDVLTQHNDALRSGLSLNEKLLTADSVRQKFAKLWTLYADAQIMAQPLYVSNLKTTKCPAGCNAVIFCTMKNTVYVYRADQRTKLADQPHSTDRAVIENRDVLLWAKYLGDPRQGGGDIDMYRTSDPWWGILGTPAIDRATNTLYVIAWNSDRIPRLHSLDLFNEGTDRVFPAMEIRGSVGNKTFDPTVQKQRAALLLLNGIVHVGFTAAGETCNQSSGFMFAYDAKTLAQRGIWSSAPTGCAAGIWQSGQGPAADPDGNIYLNTGNGTFDQNPANRQNYGDSLVKLKFLNDHYAVQASFTPCSQEFLNKCDEDLGSAGPLLLFNGKSILSGGKQGRFYFLNTNNFGKYFPGPPVPGNQQCFVTGTTGGHVLTSPRPPIPACQNDPAAVIQDFQGSLGHIHGSPIFWQGKDAGQVYVWGEEARLRAFTFRNGKFDTANVKQSRFNPPDGMPGGALSITSDGNKPGTGILWASVPLNGDANSHRGVQGVLLALDAEDISKPAIWSSQNHGGAGLLSRFTPPTAANGKVFVATLGDNEPLRQYSDQNSPNTAQAPKNYFLIVFGLRN